MAGHSKWANIKHRKGKADAKKGKIFSRLAKEIISAVKMGGEDPKSNPRLRLAIQKAREANFPNENIERNIKKALSGDQEAYSEVTYELYGHGGVGIIVDIMTDNRNRAASDIRIATNKRGGNIATPGAVAFNFDRRGLIQIKKEDNQKKTVVEDDLFLAATEAGAEDFEATDHGYIVVTDPTHLFMVKDALEARDYVCEEAELVMIPKSHIECNEEDAQANLALIEWLEDLEDVDVVHHNMKI